MGATQVAEGPLIKHVPGGFAEWRAKESGLPPARLHSSEGEWWGKLVGPTDTTDPDPIKVDPPDPIVKPVNGFTDDEKQGLDDPSFETKLRDELNKEQDQPNYNWYDQNVDQGGWKTDYTPVDWDVNYNEMPQGFGWGVSTGSPIPPYQGVGGGSGDGFRFYDHPGMTDPPKGKLGVVPGGQGDRLTTRGSAGLQKPLVDFKPSPTEYAEGYDPNNRFVEKPGVVNEAIKDLQDVATDGLKLGERWITAIAGRTAGDLRERGDYLPRNPKESVLFNKFKKGYEIFVAAVKEGGGVFGGTLYETGGGRTTTPDSKTGEVPQAHFPNILKTLRKVFAGEKNPIVMQEYGDLHWATIIATIGMANTYGPIVWAIPGLRTMADTIGASMNGMLMDKPNLEGNPIQDTMHRLFWIAGQAGQKAYDVSIGKLAEKLRGTPKSDKTRGTIAEELSDLVNIKDAYKGHKTKRIKVSGDIKAAGSKHLQPDHDPLDLQTTDPKSGAGLKRPDNSEGQREQVIGQTTSPVMGPQPQGQQGQSQTETFGGKSPEQTQVTDTKTIVPAGYPPKPLPKDDRLTQEELDAKPVQPITPEEIAELADEIMGEIPKGEKFDPNRVDPDRVDPNAVRPKTERRFTPEEQAEFNRQQQSKQDKPAPEPAPEIDPPEPPIAAKGVTIESDKPTVEPIDDRLTEEELEAGPEIRQIKEELPEIKPETIEELEQLGIKPDDDPIKPYAQIMGDPVFIKVAIDQFGRELDHTEAGFDKSQIAGFEYRDKQFPARGKDDAAAGSEEANHWGQIGDLESWFEFEKFNENRQDTGQTGQTDFRSDYQKELGLTAGNQWVNESDSSTWPAITATQSQQWNERTQQFDLSYNRNLPQSNIPGHPQYYENNPEHVMNATPDVNVEWTSAEDKGDNEEIFNWADQAGLNSTIYQPKYDNDYQFIGNEMFMLETESYPKGDGWGYRYRYNNAETSERGEWREWIPGP